MVPIREFITSVEDAFEQEPDEGEVLTLDGEKLHFFKPTDGQVAVYMASSGRHASDNERVGATIDFFIGLFGREERTLLINRLLDREDPFGVRKIEEILEALVEEWGGRPTQPSGDSTRSRKSAGRKSTARTQASTSSATPSIAS